MGACGVGGRSPHCAPLTLRAPVSGERGSREHPSAQHGSWHRYGDPPRAGRLRPPHPSPQECPPRSPAAPIPRGRWDDRGCLCELPLQPPRLLGPPARTGRDLLQSPLFPCTFVPAVAGDPAPTRKSRHLWGLRASLGGQTAQGVHGETPGAS